MKKARRKVLLRPRLRFEKAPVKDAVNNYRGTPHVKLERSYGFFSSGYEFWGFFIWGTRGFWSAVKSGGCYFCF